MRKIAVITGTRAEYGLLRLLIQAIHNHPDLELQLIATGSHLSPEFGRTYTEIEKDGVPITRKVEMLLSSDTGAGIAKSMGLGMIGFADAFSELKPDIVLVLGDRFEIFSAVSAAMSAQIPVAHLYGGELTEGAIDEAIRHCITKMSHLHFVSTDIYRNRVIQLGEQPKTVHNVGSLGVDAISKISLLSRSELEKSLDFKLAQKNLLITFHPVTLENATASQQMAELLDALAELVDTNLIFTMPNADAGGRVLISMVNDFVAQHENTRAYTSLGQLRYLSCVAQMNAVVGNSSSGLIEVPSFKKPTINIGDRQKGRIKADSVIDCEPIKSSITKALNKAYSPEFQESIASLKSPFGSGGTVEKIIDILLSTDLSNILKKHFFDIPLTTQL